MKNRWVEIAKNYFNSILSYSKSDQGKRVLKRLLVVVVVGVVVGGGIYAYAGYVKKTTQEKYTRAQNIYTEAVQTEGADKQNLHTAAKLFEEVASRNFWSYNRQEALFYLADCFYRLGELEKSVQKLKEFEKKYPSSYFSPWAQLKLALIYEEQGEYQKAINLYGGIGEQHPQSPVAPEALLGRARCQEIIHNQQEAIKIYRTLISRYPLSPQSNIAKVKLQHLGEIKG